MNKFKENDKKYFTVKVEAIVPIIMTYRVLAESPEAAVDIAIKLQGQQQNSPPVILFGKMNKQKVKVYKYGTSTLELIKNY